MLNGMLWVWGGIPSATDVDGPWHTLQVARVLTRVLRLGCREFPGELLIFLSGYKIYMYVYIHIHTLTVLRNNCGEESWILIFGP